MKISRIKFVLFFLIFVTAFLVGTNFFLNQPTESLIGSLGTQTVWQATLSTLGSPIKIILMGPLLPVIEFLRQDPDTPPPFFLVSFALYWAILALFIHYLIHRFKRIHLINN